MHYSIHSSKLEWVQAEEEDAKINRVQQAKPLDDYHTCDMPDGSFAYG